MNNFHKINGLSLAFIFCIVIIAFELQASAVCVRPTKQYEMKVNNVRARLLTGGDLFYEAQYISPVPKDGQLPVSGIYAAGMWAGGLDKSRNVKLSAVTYRSVGYDFFSGPLDLNGTTEKKQCDQWDKIFSVSGTNIKKQIQLYKDAKLNNQPLTCDVIPEDVLYWPAQGNIYFEEKYGWKLPDQPLAAFFDMDADGFYDACKGDYPTIDKDDACSYYHEGLLIPAEINYFVFNDAGGPHTSSGPAYLNMEYHVNAYAYATSNELYDMTFYQYKMINKASEDIYDFYFSWWVDPDLGCYQDDYIGCDPDLGMAYIYNEDAVDGFNGGACGGTNTYGEEIPVIGFDFVEGMWCTKNFKRNPDGSVVLDAKGNKILIEPPMFATTSDTMVRCQMSSFTYEVDINPFMIHLVPRENRLYNQMRGYWFDGSPFIYGGGGFNPGSTDTTKFVFPDYPNDLNGWSMCTAKEPYSDRRMLMSVGPTIMQPGQSNNLTMSVFTVFDIKYPCPDLSKLVYTDKLVQEFFDQCGNELSVEIPDAPEIKAIEKTNAIELTLFNAETSNNYQEKFKTKVFGASGNVDSFYRFEGYRLYQLKNKDVSFSGLSDPAFAKEIGQSDIKNGIGNIYNWNLKINPSPTGETNAWIKELATNGADQGIQRTYTIEKDMFSNGEPLINGRVYHFAAVAYAHNNWKDFDPVTKTGQKRPYIAGNVNFKVFSFSPKYHIKNDKLQPVITRISGEGNPNVFLEMEDQMYGKILSDNFDGKIKYKPDAGPLLIRVTDPDKAKNGSFRLEVSGNFLSNTQGLLCHYDDKTVWKLTDMNTSEIILDEVSLHKINEYAVSQLGFSVAWHHYADPYNLLYAKNGGIDARLTYKTLSNPKWFFAIKDDGIYHPDGSKTNAFDFVINQNDHKFNNKIPIPLPSLGDGFFVPILSTRFAADPNLPFYISPAPREVTTFSTSTNINSLRYRDLNNVDIIFTNDKSKWSKCIVVETTPNELITNEQAKTIGNARNFDLRNSLSIDKEGKLLQDGTVGFSYFPGYAVDVETGKRLNIFFGESSWFSGENAEILQGKNPIGGDLIFNPSSQALVEDFVVRHPETGAITGVTDLRAYVAGGHHYIYVTRMEYDECQTFYSRLRYSASGGSPSLNNKHRVLISVTWTSIPIPQMMLPLSQGLIPNELKVQIRVDNPYGETRRFDPSAERACLTDGDRPIYEFGFEKINSLFDFNDDKITVFPNPANSKSGTLNVTITNLPQSGLMSIYDSFGNLIETFDINSGQATFVGPKGAAFTYQLQNTVYKSGMYLIQIKDHDTGKVKVVKWMVI